MWDIPRTDLICRGPGLRTRLGQEAEEWQIWWSQKGREKEPLASGEVQDARPWMGFKLTGNF
jgi:hypothetical protein